MLAPLRVDPRPGYRWYGPDPDPGAVLVGTLRQLDVPPAEVAAILDEGDGAAQLARLDAHWAGMEASLQRGRAMRDHLARLLGGWQDLIDEHSVRERAVADLPVLLRRWRVDASSGCSSRERPSTIAATDSHQAAYLVGAVLVLAGGATALTLAAPARRRRP